MLRERVQEAAEELTVEHEKGGLDLSQRNQLLAFWMSFEQDPLAQLDDHYISQGSISVDDLRVEFEELFRVLGQHEHFEMMSLC